MQADVISKEPPPKGGALLGGASYAPECIFFFISWTKQIAVKRVVYPNINF